MTLPVCPSRYFVDDFDDLTLTGLVNFKKAAQ